MPLFHQGRIDSLEFMRRYTHLRPASRRAFVAACLRYARQHGLSV